MTTCFMFLFLTIVKICVCDDFSVVSDIFDEKSKDVIAAFGDFNADKFIDIFVISHSGRELSVLLAQETRQFTRKVLLTNESFSQQQTISAVMVADFDGDVIMDVLVCIKNSSSVDSVNLAVFWGNGSAVDVDDPYRFNWTAFKDEPVLFDFNADMRPDLLAETVDDISLVYQTSSNAKNFSVFNFSKPLHLSVPHSSAFVDVDGDYNADLVLTKNNNKEFEVFFNNDFQFNESISYSFLQNFTIGQSSFADFNQDGHIDHVVPACDSFTSDGCCSNGFVFMWDGKNQSQWTKVAGPFPKWQFLWNNTGASPQRASPYNLSLPVTLRVGDYDMDGFPDLLTVMCSAERKADRRPVLLRNVINGSGNGRIFEIQESAIPSSINSSVLATFYDYAEDGMPDIIVTILSGDAAVPSLVLLRNNLALDICFLKVTVISGLCDDNCNGRKPYGVNVPGPTVAYETTQANGRLQRSAAGQLTQSAHFSLQLPFVSFGLGQTPNFVDSVSIGIPQPKNNQVKRTKSWTQIIPNAQLIVNPVPINEPSSWKMQLFVVPSRQIYMTGIALLLTCVVMALIVAVLLWNERREDMREKKQESQRFHFDAM